MVVGEHNRSKSEVTKTAFELEQYFIHPLYDIGGWNNNDLALIRLKGSIPFCLEVAPVCLPDADVPPGKLCVATGWGYTRGGYDGRGITLYFVIV